MLSALELPVHNMSRTQITAGGDIVSEREWRKQNLEWERRRREAEDLMRTHQRDVDERRARMELRQRQKDQDSRRRQLEKLEAQTDPALAVKVPYLRTIPTLYERNISIPIMDRTHFVGSLG